MLKMSNAFKILLSVIYSVASPGLHMLETTTEAPIGAGKCMANRDT